VVAGQLDAAKGLPVTLLGTGGTPYAEQGRMLFSGINVDAETGDIVLRIVVDNPARRLLPGMFVRARVPRGVQVGALLVPQQSVLRSTGGQSYAWVVGKEGKAVIRTIEVDGQVGRQYVVSHGLQALAAGCCCHCYCQEGRWLALGQKLLLAPGLWLGRGG